MTFTEFQATRVTSDDLQSVVNQAGIDFYSEGPVGGCAYDGGRLYILRVDHPEGRYELILGNQDWLSDDLAVLEQRLYDWAVEEGQWNA
jgi:hypothetical protein